MRIEIVQKIIDLIRKKHKTQYCSESYAQMAEDIIVKKAMDLLGKSTFTYLDIGAHHPFYLSNTYLFYKNKMYGVVVEPDPFLFKDIIKCRPKDTCLNIGIGLNECESADFYIINPRTLNTFSKEEAERYEQKCGYKIDNVIKIPLKNINTIIEDNFATCPDFISIDVEGLDFEITKSINFEKYKPSVLCIETSEHLLGKTQKSIELIDFLIQQGYLIFAENMTNTIFIKEDEFKKTIGSISNIKN
jgi:FkbM family methyltransferase